MTQNPNPNGATSSADDDLNRVREILFGAEQRRTNEQLVALRHDFEQQLQAVRKDAERERQDLRAELEQQLELLRAGKIDREDLAEMFGNIVSRLGSAVAKQTGA
jgi:DNA-binding protein H-NS